MKLYRLCFSAVAMAMACSVTSQAAFTLAITEIWPGQSPEPNISDDWFEITNYGDMAWISGTDPALYVDDEGANGGNTGSVRLISGLTSIDPGQSVVVLMEANATDAAAFYGLWDITGVDVGYADGGGLGLSAGSGDTINLFLAAGSGYTLLDQEAYSGRSGDFSSSWDVVLGEWSTVGNASGAFASDALGGTGNTTPAIGSPGQVPEPSTCVIAGLAVVGLLALRKRVA